MKNTSPQGSFYIELNKFRDRYPMCYVEAWTPDDFVAVKGKGKANWGDERHTATANNLSRHFDAEYGTNWGRIKDEAERI